VEGPGIRLFARIAGDHFAILGLPLLELLAVLTRRGDIPDDDPACRRHRHPVAHSRSPRLHGHWLARYAIAGHYVPLQVAPEDLAETLALLPRHRLSRRQRHPAAQGGRAGAGHEATPEARRIGAANTLVFTNVGSLPTIPTPTVFLATSSIIGRTGRRERSPSSAPGGAARAVLAALLDRGAAEIRLTNRTPDRARGWPKSSARRSAGPWAGARKCLRIATRWSTPPRLA
jgi:hypothetical protein